MVDLLDIPEDKHQLLRGIVEDFIRNKKWYLPHSVLLNYPSIAIILQDVHIPNFRTDDKLVWKHTNSGSPSIQPDKYLLVWRLFHKEVPADENLCARGCNVVSYSNLCDKAMKTSQHLFWDYTFMKNCWGWLASTLDQLLLVVLSEVNVSFVGFSFQNLYISTTFQA